MFIKLCNIGQNAITRYTPQGTPVTPISCAYTVGFGNNQKTQWLEAELWGKRGEKLADKLKKGRQILLTADDIQVESFIKGDHTAGAKLKCRVVDISFTGPAQPDHPPQQNEGATPAE